jgi:hypothetical protein
VKLLDIQSCYQLISGNNQAILFPNGALSNGTIVSPGMKPAKNRLNNFKFLQTNIKAKKVIVNDFKTTLDSKF